MNARQNPVCTIGHSNRSFDCFAQMILGAEVDMVIDVRTFPRSRSNPQFNIEILPAALRARRIDYEHWASLGGRRKRQAGIDPETNRYWENQSFHNYADYALLPEFREAIDALAALSRDRRLALMCSEAVWWRCHRRIIADYLLARGLEVLHIMDAGKLTPAKMTPGAVAASASQIEYPEPEA